MVIKLNPVQLPSAPNVNVGVTQRALPGLEYHAPSVNVGALTAPHKAAIQTNQQMIAFGKNIADTATEFQERSRKMEQATTHRAYERFVDETFLRWHNEALENKDSQMGINDYTIKVKAFNLKNAQLKKVTDPETRAIMTAYANKRFYSGLKTLHAFHRKRTIDLYNASNIQRITDLAGKAIDSDEHLVELKLLEEEINKSPYANKEKFTKVFDSVYREIDMSAYRQNFDAWIADGFNPAEMINDDPRLRQNDKDELIKSYKYHRDSYHRDIDAQEKIYLRADKELQKILRNDIWNRYYSKGKPPPPAEFALLDESTQRTFLAWEKSNKGDKNALKVILQRVDAGDFNYPDEVRKEILSTNMSKDEANVAMTRFKKDNRRKPLLKIDEVQEVLKTARTYIVLSGRLLSEGTRNAKDIEEKMFGVFRRELKNHVQSIMGLKLSRAERKKRLGELGDWFNRRKLKYIPRDKRADALAFTWNYEISNDIKKHVDITKEKFWTGGNFTKFEKVWGPIIKEVLKKGSKISEFDQKNFKAFIQTFNEISPRSFVAQLKKLKTKMDKRLAGVVVPGGK
ncbi:hypothetical protein [uncultured Mediterranean phage uvDeep-CGR2-AD3-C191]|nr:hypothetical protein [uncultured Mediterranean phage uvDeep-CGR2-AD3-C191]